MFFGPFGVKQNIYQGSGCVSVIPKIFAAEGWKRVMIVADPGVEKAGLIKRFEEMFKSENVEYTLFTNIRPNPEAATVENEALPLYRKYKADVMIAIGGGSTMDTAKGVALIGESNLKIKDLPMAWKPFPVSHKTFPMVAVPTTCGTGSESCNNAVISGENEFKYVPQSEAILPKYAVCDPDLLASLPPSVAAASGMDALVQAIEGYVSLGANPMSELFSLKAVELLGAAIRPYYANRANPKWADMMSLGCLYDGIGWGLSKPAQNHASNHGLTEQLHISHGEAAAILLPPFIEWNGLACKEKFKKVYYLMFPEKAYEKAFEVRMLADEMMILNKDLNILGGKTLADFGCNEQMVDVMLKNFGPRPGFPRTTTKDDWKNVFMKVMNGEYTIR